MVFSPEPFSLCGRFAVSGLAAKPPLGETGQFLSPDVASSFSGLPPGTNEGLEKPERLPSRNEQLMRLSTFWAPNPDLSERIDLVSADHRAA